MHILTPIVLLAILAIATQAREITDCGSDNQEYKTCGCQITCLNFLQVVPCEEESCTEGCFCKPNYAEDSTGVCIDIFSCKRPDPCGENEEQLESGSSCPPTCEEPDRTCNDFLRAGCFCKSGFLRNSSNVCVLENHCPGIESSTTISTESTTEPTIESTTEAPTVSPSNGVVVITTTGEQYFTIESSTKAGNRHGHGHNHGHDNDHTHPTESGDDNSDGHRHGHGSNRGKGHGNGSGSKHSSNPGNDDEDNDGEGHGHGHKGPKDSRKGPKGKGGSSKHGRKH